MNRVCIFLTLVFLSFSNTILKAQKPVFKVIPLGVKGGGDESNLSAYLVAPDGDEGFICLDAGTVRAGIQQSINRKVLTGTAEKILQENIRAYCISHPHLDHLAGLIINSPDDTKKNIYGLPFCLNIVADKYFSWKSWANFSDLGETPRLGKYHMVEMTLQKKYPVENTSMTLEAFPLSHSSPYQSTAFLVGHNDAYLLYLGDTGADTIENSTNLFSLWQKIAPLIVAKKLKGIFIEVSFADDQKKEQLFGHLTPQLLMLEMQKLETIAGINSLKNFPVMITHMKPGGDREQQIRKQLTSSNKPGLKLIFAEQAVPVLF